MTSIQVTVREGGPKRGVTYQFDKDLNGSETLEDLLDFNQRATLSIAREVLKDEQRVGFDKDPRVRTDNIFDKDDRKVKPFGKIEYFARQDVSEAIVDIYRELEKRSPRDTGQYISGNWLYYNNIKVATTLSEAEKFVKLLNKRNTIKPNDTFRIINVNPYARRLEYQGVRRETRGGGSRNYTRGGRKGKARKTGNIVRRPNGAYYLTYRLIRRRYRAIGESIRYTFVPGNSNGLAIPKIRADFRTTFAGGKKGSTGRPYLYPSIVIKLDTEGITGEFEIE